MLERAGAGEEPLASAVGAAGDRDQRGDAWRESWTRRWAATAASWTDTSRGWKICEAAMPRRPWRWMTARPHKALAEDFCAILARDIEHLRAMHGWLGGGGNSDIEAAGASGGGYLRATSRTASPRWDLSCSPPRAKPRKKLATKTLADARPDLLAYLTALASALLRRRRAAQGRARRRTGRKPR